MPLFLIPNAANLTGDTLAAGVTASSLTSVGTLTALTVSGQSSFAAGTAAAPSVKVGTVQDGLFSVGAGTLGVAVNGAQAIRVDGSASSVNYLWMYGNTTGNSPSLGVLGTDANIPLAIGSKGTSPIDFFTNQLAIRQFRVAHTANAVNLLQVTGSATGGYVGFAAIGADANVGITYTAKGTGTHDYYVRNGVNFRVSASTDNAINYFTVTGQVTGFGPLLLAGGSDANVSALYRTQGTGSHQFETGSSGNIGLLISHVASAVNYLRVFGSATGGSLGFFAEGADTNISNYYGSKGTGFHNFATGAGLSQFYITHTASAVNCFSVTGSAAGGFSNILESIGTDSNIQNLYASKGTSGHVFRTGGSGGFTQLLVSNAASAVNYAGITGGATGVRPKFYVDGTDANIGMNFAVKGTGSYRFDDGAGVPNLLVSAVTSAVNYPVLTSSATGNAVTISAQGSDTNIGAYLATKGSGAWRFATGGGDQFRIGNVASAVNYWSAYGAATGNPPIFYADGSDPNISAGYSLKGTGSHVFYTGSTSAVQLVIAHVASSVNWPVISGSATGNAVTISTNGSDANIDFAITPKGTGVLRFGAHRELAAETVTGYITVKDSAGNTRKLAVVS